MSLYMQEHTEMTPELEQFGYNRPEDGNRDIMLGTLGSHRKVSL